MNKLKCPIANLAIPSIDREMFLTDPFYNTQPEKIQFDGAIKEYKIQSDRQTDYVSLAAKFIPHSDYELMLQSTDSKSKSAPTALTTEAIQKILETGYRFIEFLSNPEISEKYGLTNGYPYLVYNYDEFTTDRHSGMSKKDFHLHMNSWTEKTMSNIKPIEKDKVSSFYYRSVVDPIFDITQTLASDALESEELRKYLTPSLHGNDQVPYSSIYEIKNGWKSLSDKDFAELLKTIHTKLEQRYKEILSCFTGESTIPPLYTRHELLSQDRVIGNIESSSMQDTTKKRLINTTGKLRSINSDQFQKIGSKVDFRDMLISLRWLAYSVGLFSDSRIDKDTPHIDKPLLMNVTPRLFTKIGGASIMNFPENPLVKIDRGKGTVSKSDFMKKSEFHKEFAKCLE